MQHFTKITFYTVYIFSLSLISPIMAMGPDSDDDNDNMRIAIAISLEDSHREHKGRVDSPAYASDSEFDHIPLSDEEDNRAAEKKGRKAQHDEIESSFSSLKRGSRYIGQKLGIIPTEEQRKRIALMGPYVNLMLNSRLQHDPYTGKVQELPTDLKRIVCEYLRADYGIRRQWSIPQGITTNILSSIVAVGGKITQLSAPPDRHDRLAVATSQTVYVIDPRSGKQVREFTPFPGILRLNNLRFITALANDRVVAFPDMSSFVSKPVVCNGNNQSHTAELPQKLYADAISNCITLDNGSAVLTQSPDLYLWKSDGSITKLRKDVGGRIISIPSDRIAAGYSGTSSPNTDTICIFEGQEGSKIAELSGERKTNAALRSIIPLDTNTLLTVNDDDSVKTWNITTQENRMLIPSDAGDDAAQNVRDGNRQPRPVIALPHRLFALYDAVRQTLDIRCGDTGEVCSTIAMRPKQVEPLPNNRFAVCDADRENQVDIYVPLSDGIEEYVKEFDANRPRS